jgi:hypothetical protein
MIKMLVVAVLGLSTSIAHAEVDIERLKELLARNPRVCTPVVELRKLSECGSAGTTNEEQSAHMRCANKVFADNKVINAWNAHVYKNCNKRGV